MHAWLLNQLHNTYVLGSDIKQSARFASSNSVFNSNNLSYQNSNLPTKMKSVIILLILASVSTALPVRKLQQRSTTENRLCSTGRAPFHQASVVTSKSERGVLYVDPSRPLTCEGRVDMIEICFTITNDFAQGFSINLIVLRPVGNDYAIQQTVVVPFTQLTSGNVLSCQNLTVPEPLNVEEGDLIGFRPTNKIEIAFTMQGSIHSVNIQPTLGETVQTQQIDSRSQNELPMFRTFIGECNNIA